MQSTVEYNKDGMSMQLIQMRSKVNASICTCTCEIIVYTSTPIKVHTHVKNYTYAKLFNKLRIWEKLHIHKVSKIKTIETHLQSEYVHTRLNTCVGTEWNFDSIYTLVQHHFDVDFKPPTLHQP